MSGAEIIDQKLIDGVQDLAVQDQVFSCFPRISLKLILLILNYFLFVIKMYRECGFCAFICDPFKI